jgi:hypothetical protein
MGLKSGSKLELESDLVGLDFKPQPYGCSSFVVAKKFYPYLHAVCE